MRSKFNTGEKPDPIRLAVGEFAERQVWAAGKLRWEIIELIPGTCPEVIVSRDNGKPKRRFQYDLRRDLFSARAKVVGGGR